MNALRQSMVTGPSPGNMVVEHTEDEHEVTLQSDFPYRSCCFAGIAAGARSRSRARQHVPPEPEIVATCPSQMEDESASDDMMDQHREFILRHAPAWRYVLVIGFGAGSQAIRSRSNRLICWPRHWMTLWQVETTPAKRSIGMMVMTT
jgi:hypothetical protein